MADGSKRDSSLRKPTRSQEANAKKRRRLASFGMTGLGGVTGLAAAFECLVVYHVYMMASAFGGFVSRGDSGSGAACVRA